MAKIKKAAIVGCGSISQIHAVALKNIEEAQLVAVADIKLERAEKLANEYGAKPYSTLEEMLENERIDVLHICTPHYLHLPMLELAQQKGIAVFTEKPPVISYEQWQKLEKLSCENSIGICFQNRYNEATRYIEKVLASGKAGKIKGSRAFVTWSRDDKYYTESGWRGTWETEGGGALINQSIHTLDLMVRFLGTPKAVEANIANHHLKGIIEVEDTLEAFVGFGDKIGCFYATTAYCEDSPVLLEIVCENAKIIMEANDNCFVRWNDGKVDNMDFSAELSSQNKAYWGASHEICIQDFYTCLNTGKPYQNNISSVEDTVKLMLAVYESARDGKVVEIY